MIGRSVAHYALVEKLGEGGMGVVYKARDERLDRFVALKILPAEKMVDPDRRRRFVQEAKAASALNHPNIVTVYDIGEADGVHFIAMEHVEGRTLDGLIGRKGLPLKEALALAVQIADGLGKAHASGIVHRDLKPSNIMVTADGLVKVLDFGLAKLMEKSGPPGAVGATMSMTRTPATEEGVILGTVAYMSPEQAAGKPLDARSDIFSFGSVFYEMLTGRRAFEGETKASTMAAVIALDPAAPTDAAGELPAEVARVVMRCLRKDPQRRWQNMADLKVALQDLKEESESGLLSAPAAPAPGKRRSWLVPLLAGAAILAAAVGVLLLLKPAPGPAMAQPERITFEQGLAFWPAVSPDGNMIAYSSNRDGNMDIYVRLLSGQESIRRTQHPAIDWYASFSPDGSKLVFRSERDGGGLYVMEALGGSERRVADRGRLPSFSPDGKTILYLISAALTRQAKLYLVPADGGTPRPFQPEFVAVPRGASHSTPLWSADGEHILFDGMRPGEPGSRGWWLAPVAGGPAVRIEPPANVGRRWVRVISAWWGGDVYYSEGSTIGGMSLFRVPFSTGSRPEVGPPQLVASPAGMQWGASISWAGQMVFCTMYPRINVWSVSLDKDGVALAGRPPEAFTSDATGKIDLSVSDDGSKVAWTSYTLQKMEIRTRETATGREDSIVCSNSTLGVVPRLSPDGSMLAYSDIVGGKRTAYIAESGAAPHPFSGSGIILDFFNRAAEVLTANGNLLERQDFAGANAAVVLDTTGQGELEDIALSPSDRTLAFTIALPDGTAALYLADVGREPAAVGSWTKVDGDSNFIGSPAWSTDGRTLYYCSHRDDWLCVWAQRIGGDGRPSGRPFAAYHAHTPPDMNMYGVLFVRAAPNRLYMLLSEFKGDLWSLKLSR